LNPNVITDDMMAPSLETSYDAEGHLPLALPSPVRAMSLAMCQYQNLQDDNAHEITAGASHSQAAPAWHSVAKEAVEALASTSAAYLVDGTPLNSSHQLPTYLPHPLTPTQKRKHALLDEEPDNEKERAYQDALLEAYAREAQYKSVLVGSQAMLVLQGMYVERVTKELANHEEKQKKKKKGQLNGDGLPKLLTGDEFYNQVVDHHITMAEQEAAHETHRKQRDERSGLLSVWKEEEQA